MSVPADPPPAPDRRVEELLELEHELDVAGDSHPARPNTWATGEQRHPPAPLPGG